MRAFTLLFFSVITLLVGLLAWGVVGPEVATGAADSSSLFGLLDSSIPAITLIASVAFLGAALKVARDDRGS